MNDQQILLRAQQIRDAKAILREAGYSVGRLWNVSDVQKEFPNLSNEQAMDVLERSFAPGGYIDSEGWAEIYENGERVINENANDYEEDDEKT